MTTRLDRGRVFRALLAFGLVMAALPVAIAGASTCPTNPNQGGSHWESADLSSCNLAGFNFTGADMDGVNLSFANLTGASLNHAQLSGASLFGANLTRTNLSGANLSDTDADHDGGCSSGSGADLTGATLVSTNLSGANLSGNCGLGAHLDGDTLNGVNLSNANVNNATDCDTIFINTNQSGEHGTFSHDCVCNTAVVQPNGVNCCAVVTTGVRPDC